MARLSAALLVVAASCAVAVPAGAHGTAGGAQLPKDPPAVAPDGHKAKAELAAIAKDERAKTIVAAPVDKAKKALARAHGAHLAGDADGARLLSRVALAWSKASRAVLCAADVEKRAKDLQTKAEDLRERLARAKALLAETEARKGPLAAEIARAEAGAKTVTEAALDAEKKRIDKAHKQEPKKAPKNGGGRR